MNTTFDRLRRLGIPVWVSRIESVPQAVTALDELFVSRLGWGRRPAWLNDVEALWCGPIPQPTLRVAIPIWRDPWMVVGRNTFAGDVVRRLGMKNVFDSVPERYKRLTPADIDAQNPDLVLLPDEPYRFTPTDGPEALRSATKLISGRHLTWYGPSLIEAARHLPLTFDGGRQD